MKIKLRPLFLLVSASLVLVFPLHLRGVLAHNIYSSFAQIDWNDSDNSIELVLQIHSHELETKLSLLLDKRLSFLEEGDFVALQAATGEFIDGSVSLAIDGVPVTLVFLGIETDGQTVFAYLEQDWPSQPHTITFRNDMFLDDLPDQINSTLAIVKGVRKGGNITRDSGPLRFDF